MNGGVVIQQRPCPRCAISRTVRLGSSQTSLCFNCRTRWASNSATGYPRRAVESAQLSRLEIYRAAIQAGFYTDWPITHR